MFPPLVQLTLTLFPALPLTDSAWHGTPPAFPVPYISWPPSGCDQGEVPMGDYRVGGKEMQGHASSLLLCMKAPEQLLLPLATASCSHVHQDLGSASVVLGNTTSFLCPSARVTSSFLLRLPSGWSHHLLCCVSHVPSLL